MTRFYTFLVLFIALGATAQDVTPIVDFNNYFKSFQNGFFRQIEFQPVTGIKYGDNVVAYYDNRSNLRVYDGSAPRDLANVDAEYEVSDNLMIWKIGPTLNLWDDGDLKTLTYFANRYTITDSLVVFEDTRFNTVNVYYNKEVYTIVNAVGELTMPDHVGENIIAFRDNGDVYKVFWRGKVYELGSWHDPIKFKGQTDILAFNDPINGTFAIFENGQFLDLEMFFVNEYKAGQDFVSYTDLNGNLKYYKKGKVQTLSNFGPSFWEVNDNVVVWGENNIFYSLVEGKKTEIARFIPKDYAVKNSVIAFRNQMGGVSAVVDGKTTELTNQMDAVYTLHGNAVLVELFNKSFIFFKDGKKYRL